MDWIDEAEREVVERILVLLVALSGHAGHVADLPLFMRLPVLLALSRAESAAQSYCAGLPQAALTGLAQDAPALADAHDTGSWAERLAVRLLALAAVLTLVLARAAGEAPSLALAAGCQALRTIARRLHAAPTLRAPAATPAPDTS